MSEIPKAIEDPDLVRLRASLQQFIDAVASGEYDECDDEKYKDAIVDAALHTFYGDNVGEWIVKCIDEIQYKDDDNERR